MWDRASDNSGFIMSQNKVKLAKDDKGSLTYERVRELFDYDDISGNVYWKINRSTRRKPGQLVGWISKDDGRRYVEIEGCNYRLHRIIWLWKTGFWPEYEIDHIDTNPANNAWNNLREADHSQNNCNCGPQSNNTTGVRGVDRLRRRNGVVYYRVRVHKDKEQVYLGYFNTLEEAAAVRKEVAIKYHGEFARHRKGGLTNAESSSATEGTVSTTGCCN